MPGCLWRWSSSTAWAREVLRAFPVWLDSNCVAAASDREPARQQQVVLLAAPDCLENYGAGQVGSAVRPAERRSRDAWRHGGAPAGGRTVPVRRAGAGFERAIGSRRSTDPGAGRQGVGDPRQWPHPGCGGVDLRLPPAPREAGLRPAVAGSGREIRSTESREFTTEGSTAVWASVLGESRSPRPWKSARRSGRARRRTPGVSRAALSQVTAWTSRNGGSVAAVRFRSLERFAMSVSLLRRDEELRERSGTGRNPEFAMRCQKENRFGKQGWKWLSRMIGFAAKALEDENPEAKDGYAIGGRVRTGGPEYCTPAVFASIATR